MPPRPLIAKPAAIALAARIMAKRRRTWAPLTGDVLLGFKAAAMKHGFGVAIDGQPRWPGYGTKSAWIPAGVETQAGWLIWVGERWGESVNEIIKPGKEASRAA
jgi:hypothetical protein